MGYLKCNKCGEVYRLQKRKSPDDNICQCGGEIEYYLSSYELKKKKQYYIPSEEKIEKNKSSDKIIIFILIIVALVVLMALPALLLYRAYFS